MFIFAQLDAKELDTFTIVNGSYGGGWELTSKVTGETLVSLGLANNFKIKTKEGATGWRALEMFLSNERHKEDILVQSEPLISGFLMKRYGSGFRDLRPVALMSAEYACIVVANDSPYKNFADILTAIKKDHMKIPISLGGRRGAGDHIIANMIFKAAGITDPTKLRYIFSDGGDSAAIKYLSKMNKFIGISGYNSIIIDALKKKDIRIIAVTSANRVDGHMTLKEHGVDIEYANWRGFFARKDIPNEKFNTYLKVLKTLSESPEWKVVLKRNVWSSFFKSGPELIEFLTQHEQRLKATMQDLKIIEK